MLSASPSPFFKCHHHRQGKLDAVLVYALPAALLIPDPAGASEHAVAVARPLFQDLSLPDPSGNYFLRPEYIVGAFLVDPQAPPRFTATSGVAAADEVAADRRAAARVRRAQRDQVARADAAHDGMSAAGAVGEADRCVHAF